MAARQQVPATAYRKNFPNFPTVVETKKKPDVGPGETAGPSVKPFRHPYMRLLDNFEPPEYQLKKQSEDPPRNVSKTPLIEISTREELEGLVKALEGVRHIAVHCTFATQKYEDELLLLGISTNTADYAIDVPTLGKENLRILQGVLANPDLVKVFISSRVCIYCLQQTLNLFLVNVFDLTSAAQKLGETLDIATHLKEKYGVILKVNIDPFDSSIRPLPDDVKNNCRYSTHYSLHMYRQFKNRLIDKSVKDYRAFLRQCNGACTIKHEVDKEGNFRELKERIERMQRGQLVIVEKLHRWREEVGRSIDKNPSDVLNTVRLKLLAVEMPESHEDILEIARSPHVEKDIEAVAKIVREAIKKYIRMDSTETVDQKKVDRDVEVVGASNQKRPVMPQSVNRKRKHDKKGKWSNSRNLSGLDIRHIGFVINFDLPRSAESYIHRVSRTARAGRAGRALNVVIQYDVAVFQWLERKMGGKKQPLYVTEWDAVLQHKNRVMQAANEAKSAFDK